MRDSTTFAPVNAAATRTEIGSMSTASNRTPSGAAAIQSPRPQPGSNPTPCVTPWRSSQAHTATTTSVSV